MWRFDSFEFSVFLSFVGVLSRSQDDDRLRPVTDLYAYRTKSSDLSDREYH